MVEFNEELLQAETLEDLLAGYEMTMSQQADVAAEWWRDEAVDFYAGGQDPFFDALRQVNLDAIELLQTTRESVRGVTITAANLVEGMDDFPRDAVKTLRRSRQAPDLATGHAKLTGLTANPKVREGMLIGYDHVVMQRAFNARELSEGKSYVQTFASDLGRAAIEMAYDEKVYSFAGAEPDFAIAYDMIRRFTSSGPTSEAVRQGFNSRIFQAAREVKGRRAAKRFIEEHIYGDDELVDLMVHNLRSNVTPLEFRRRTKPQTETEEPKAAPEQSPKPASITDIFSGRARPERKYDFGMDDGHDDPGPPDDAC
jgi:hypothetical protein